MNNTSVESYLKDGCGRCDQFQTPTCKVHLWTEALVALRALVRATELVETMKWGSPCYTLNGKNVLMITSFRGYCTLTFFKGVLLPHQELLVPIGPNTQDARQIRFTSIDGVRSRQTAITTLLTAAITVQRAGDKPPARMREPTPVELDAVLDADPTLRAAFDALTPGRQRSYILHVGGAKQSKTRTSRAQKAAPKMLAGKGFNER